MPVPPEVKRQMDAEMESALKDRFLEIAEDLIGLSDLKPLLLDPLGIEHIGNLNSDQMLTLVHTVQKACWLRQQIEDGENVKGFLRAFIGILLRTSKDHEAIVRQIVQTLEEQSRIVSLKSR